MRRERVIEVLGVAAVDGRLTMAELEKRVEGALTARTSGELAQLTADLPEVGGVAAKVKEVVRLDYQGGKWRTARPVDSSPASGKMRPSAGL